MHQPQAWFRQCLLRALQQTNSTIQQFMWKNSSLLSCTAKRCTVMHCTRHSWTWCTTRYLSPNSNITKFVYLHLECAKVWFGVLYSLWFIYSINVDISTTNAVQCNAVQPCHFDVILDLESLNPYFMKKDKNFYRVAVIDTYFEAHTDIHTSITKCFITIINCSQDTHLIVWFRYWIERRKGAKKCGAALF